MGQRRGPVGIGVCFVSLFAAMIVVPEPCARAQPVRLTLEECLTRALEHHPDMLESVWDIRLAESRVEEADAGRYPIASVTSLTGIVTSVEGQVHEPPVDTVDKKGDLGPFTRVELEFVQPLFTWGKISAGRKAAAKGLEQEKEKRKQTREEVVLDVKRLYYDTQLARQITDLLGDVKENFEHAIEIAEGRLESEEGTVTQSDVLKLKIGLSGIAQEVFKASGGAELAQDALARAVGIEPGREFEIADTMMEPVVATLRDLDEYVDGVFSRSPQWKQLLAGIAAREAQVVMEESDYFPALFVAGGFRYAYAPERDRQLSPFANDEFNVLELPGAVFGIRWPLSFMQTRAKVHAAKAELEKLRAKKQAAATGIRLAVKKAYLEALQQRDALAESRNGRKAARGLLVTSVSAFELGVGESQEVFESLVVYTQSSSSYYEAISDYNVAIANLSQTVGEEVAQLEY